MSRLRTVRTTILSALTTEIVRGAIYLVCLVAGIGMVVWSPLILQLAIGPFVTDAIGCLVAISAAVSLGGMVAHAYQVEWGGLAILGAGITMYALTAWALTFGMWPGRLVEAALFTGLALALLLRVLDLWRFAYDAQDSKRRGQLERNREAPRADA